MKKIFNEYGGVIIVVIAVVALIGLVSLLMQPGGVMYSAFGSITQAFVDKSEEMVDGAGSSGGSGEAVLGCDTLYWDGNMDDEIVVKVTDETYFVRVSDAILTLDDLNQGGITTYNTGDTCENLPGEAAIITDEFLQFADSHVWFIQSDNITFEGVTIPKSGVYFLYHTSGLYVTSLTVTDYTGFPIVD